MQPCESTVHPPKRILVTGGTSGIGKSLIRQLVEYGFDIVCTSRRMKYSSSEEKEEMLEDIPPGKRSRLNFLPLNLNTIQTVEEALPAIIAHHQSRPFDVIVLNAGVMLPTCASAPVEPTFQVNYLGHYMLARALIKSRPSPDHQLHFVGVSSILIKYCVWPIMAFPSTMEEMIKAYGPRSGIVSGWAEYAYSKGCLAQLTLDLAEQPNVTSAIVDPGNSATAISRNMPYWQRRLLGMLCRRTLIPVEQAAGRVLNGVLSPSTSKTTWYSGHQALQLPEYILNKKARQCLAEFTEKVIAENSLHH